MKKINEPNQPLWMKSNNDEIEFYNDPQEDHYVIKLYGSEYIGLHIGEVRYREELGYDAKISFNKLSEVRAMGKCIRAALNQGKG